MTSIALARAHGLHSPSSLLFPLLSVRSFHASAPRATAPSAGRKTFLRAVGASAAVVVAAAGFHASAERESTDLNWMKVLAAEAGPSCSPVQSPEEDDPAHLARAQEHGKTAFQELQEIFAEIPEDSPLYSIAQQWVSGSSSFTAPSCISLTRPCVCLASHDRNSWNERSRSSPIRISPRMRRPCRSSSSGVTWPRSRMDLANLSDGMSCPPASSFFFFSFVEELSQDRCSSPRVAVQRCPCSRRCVLWT